LALVIGFGGPTYALEWRRVQSPAQGISVSMPTDLIEADQPYSAQGQYSLARGAMLALNMRPLGGRSLDEFIRQNLPPEAEITYRRRKADWLAYSGYFGNGIFYGRTHLSCGGAYAHSFLIRYPQSERTLYDPVVERMSLSFRVQPRFAATHCGGTTHF
jgi:serine/threonine-protein kinase